MYHLLDYGFHVAPREQMTREIPHLTIEVNMRRPVLRVVERHLNYRFMAAEAYWILSGDDKVENIAPWNPRIADFSDDKVRFFGAYGPKIVSQLPYIIDKLLTDPYSRQAGLTIWRENPSATKDVPCTVAIFFSIRDSKVNAHVFMRSSDVWLGIPYDVFNFSMLAHLVCGLLNERLPYGTFYSPGTLYLTAASSHLYEVNWKSAAECMTGTLLSQPNTADELWMMPFVLMDTLKNLRDSSPGSPLRWWEGVTE